MSRKTVASVGYLMKTFSLRCKRMDRRECVQSRQADFRVYQSIVRYKIKARLSLTPFQEKPRSFKRLEIAVLRALLFPLFHSCENVRIRFNENFQGTRKHSPADKVDKKYPNSSFKTVGLCYNGIIQVEYNIILLNIPLFFLPRV